MVRRKTELPKDRDTLSRSIYVKGFATDATLEDLEAFFAQHSSQVEAIRFRRHPKDRAFKGSVFVELASEAEAARLAGLTLHYGDAATPLITKSKMAYFQDELAEKQARKSSKSAAVLDKFGRGCLARLPGFPAALTVEAVKEALKETTFPVAYVDLAYEPGCAWIRFREPVAQKFSEAAAAGEVALGEHRISDVQVASEEEQSKYYESTVKARDAGRKDKRQKRPTRDQDAAKAEAAGGEGEDEGDADAEAEAESKRAKVEEVAEPAEVAGEQ